jgi:hypothetical protein
MGLLGLLAFLSAAAFAAFAARFVEHGFDLPGRYPDGNPKIASG